MNIIRALQKQEIEFGLEFVVIGGHAVITHGYTRTTADLDILTRQRDSLRWTKSLESLGYSLFHKHEVFLQFKPPLKNSWPIDLMTVNDTTFEKIKAHSIDANIQGVTVKVASLEHLIATKLHAIGDGFERRGLKDVVDISKLLENTEKKPSKEEFRHLCKKFATIEVYEEYFKKYFE